MAMNMSKTSMSQGQMNIRQATSNIFAGRSSVCAGEGVGGGGRQLLLVSVEAFPTVFFTLLSLSHSLFALF